MQFVDEATIEVRAGNGGNGSAAMRREKYNPFGGPSGGDGGRGGDVIFVGDPHLTTLLDLRYRRTFKADHGEHGRGSDRYGRGGEDVYVKIPCGTQVFDAETGELLVDMTDEGQEFIAAKGGRGGWGNLHFATPWNQAPTRADAGLPGEHKSLRLELKLLADVGLLGYPSVGKSTFIASVSRARPKIADYPFTTLAPNLGVVSLGEERNFVVADMPGIIEGAAEGAGLGIRFLKHIERTRVLFHIITLDGDPDRKPGKDFDILLDELQKFDEHLASRPMIVGVSKIDIPEVREALPNIKRALKRRGISTIYPFSAATHEGVDDVLIALETLLRENPISSAPRAKPLAKPERPKVEVESDDESEGESDDDYVVYTRG